MKAAETLQLLDSPQAAALMEKLYGREAAENTGRYRDMIGKFQKTFGDRDILMFSSPGRTEITRITITARFLPEALTWTV